MKAIFFFILFFVFSKAGFANDTCENYEPLGGDVFLFDWLAGEAPYGKSNFDEGAWKVNHLEVPMLNIPIAIRHYLSSKELLKIEDKDIPYLMNSVLIKMPGENQSAYLARGVIYSYSGKIDVFQNPKDNNLFVVHGTIHNSSVIKKESFRFQPVIVYLENEPKMINITLAEGSASAFEYLCGRQLDLK